MLHPTYKLQIGSETIDPSSSDDLVSLNVCLDMDIPVDCVRAYLRLRESGFTFKKGDSITASLGYDDSLEDVFTGFLDTVEIRVSDVKILAFNSMTLLLKLNIDRVYEQQNAGRIVSDLADSAKVNIDQISDGIQFPYYAVDGNRNVYEHILKLAEKCGFDVYMTSEDKLAFKKYEASEPHVFEYASDIIAAKRFEQYPVFQAVRVTGESPSSSKGADTYHWLTKTPPGANVQRADIEGAELLIEDSSLKTTDTASKVANAKLDKLKKTVLVMLHVVGSPDVKLGGTVKIQGMPEGSLNNEYQVRGIEHILSKSKGFTSYLKCIGEPKLR